MQILEPTTHWPFWLQLLIAGALTFVWLTAWALCERLFHKKPDGGNGVGKNQHVEGNENTTKQAHGDLTEGEKVGGDKLTASGSSVIVNQGENSTAIIGEPKTKQSPLRPTLAGLVRERPNEVYLEVTNTDGETHEFKLRLLRISGTLDDNRLNLPGGRLPWSIGQPETLWPKQPHAFLIARARAENGGAQPTRSVLFVSDFEERTAAKQWGRVPFGTNVELDIEIQANAAIEQGYERSTWLLTVDPNGKLSDLRLKN
jgi:hypothetical protein